MTQEQVVEALERCTQDPSYGTCAGCPYEGVGDTFAKCCLALMFDCLDLLKAQEPRLITEQEMRDAEPGAVIYCEQRDEVRTYLTPLIKYDDGVFENRFLGAEPEATQLPNVRFWTSRPTDEQREATPWEQ